MSIRRSRHWRATSGRGRRAADTIVGIDNGPSATGYLVRAFYMNGCRSFVVHGCTFLSSWFVSLCSVLSNICVKMTHTHGYGRASAYSANETVLVALSLDAQLNGSSRWYFKPMSNVMIIYAEHAIEPDGFIDLSIYRSRIYLYPPLFPPYHVLYSLLCEEKNVKLQNKTHTLLSSPLPPQNPTLSSLKRAILLKSKRAINYNSKIPLPPVTPNKL